MENLFDNTILIVDDTPENIDILIELLEDFEKKIAINGEDALETAFEGDPPDLILLDIMMPEMDGYEVCRLLRADERTKEVPVIFLTAKTSKEDIVKGFEAGGQDYITKPFDARELMERVKTQLELKTQREILKNMNEVLEQKVQERTAQLNEANLNLEKANKELIGLDVARNNFLNMISHELRTPLNGISGASYLLKDMLPEDSELGEFVDMLKISVQRLEKFSTTALVITQLQTKSEIKKEQKELTALVKASIEELAEKAVEKQVRVLFDDPDEEHELGLNNDLMARTLTSVLDNAIKYSGEEQQVDVKISRENDQIAVEIADRGAGFSEEALNNLFQPFGLGEAHYDKNVGLSLRAAKLIMEAHSGDIKIANRPDGGAVVKLVFNL